MRFGRRIPPPPPKPERRLETVIRQRVVVHLAAPDSRSIAGVLTGEYADSITLGAARLLVESAGPMPMDGEVIVPLARIAFVQAGVTLGEGDLK